MLCNARAMGEFGAVSVVSGHIRGLTNTMPLHIEILYNEYNLVGAFAVASLLALLALRDADRQDACSTGAPDGPGRDGAVRRRMTGACGASARVRLAGIERSLLGWWPCCWRSRSLALAHRCCSSWPMAAGAGARPARRRRARATCARSARTR